MLRRDARSDSPKAAFSATCSCSNAPCTWIPTLYCGIYDPFTRMKRSIILIVAVFGLVLLLWTASLIFLLPYLQSDLNPSERLYLESCRHEAQHCRSQKVFERRYSFNPDQPEIDIVYTWVNGSDPVHQQGLCPLFVIIHRYATDTNPFPG